MRALNLGCGRRMMENRDGFNVINLDQEPSLNPDIVADFTEKIPFGDEEFDEVYLFHTIEHIQKCFHHKAFMEIRRVLKPGGVFYMSYPEFSVICKYWLENKQGNREFWEKTIFGRQLYPSDFHLCAADSVEFQLLLEGCGFKNVEFKLEPNQYNTILKCVACDLPITRERLVFDEIINTGSPD